MTPSQFRSQAQQFVTCQQRVSSPPPPPKPGPARLAGEWLSEWVWVPLPPRPYTADDGAGGYLRRRATITHPHTCNSAAERHGGAIAQSRGRNYCPSVDGESSSSDCELEHAFGGPDAVAAMQHELDAQCLLETSDVAAAPATVSRDAECVFEFTVSFNYAYHCPVLYVEQLRPRRCSRAGKKRRFPCVFRAESTEEQPHVVSEELHPLHHRCCFMVNPCGTHDTLQQFAPSDKRDGGAGAGGGRLRLLMWLTLASSLLVVSCSPMRYASITREMERHIPTSSVDGEPRASHEDPNGIHRPSLTL